MSDDRLAACGSCQFYEALDNEIGMCVRYPPVYVGPNPDPGFEDFPHWEQPTTDVTGYCGEYLRA